MFLVIRSTNKGRRKDISNATRMEIVNKKRNGVNNGRISHLCTGPQLGSVERCPSQTVVQVRHDQAQACY